MQNETEGPRLLAGSWEDRDGLVLHEKGSTATSFTVHWEVDLLTRDDGPLQLRLRRLDLVGRPVELPGGQTGLLSITSALQLGELGDLGYDPEAGEFSALVPMLVHAPLAGERAAPDDDERHEIHPVRLAALARFEGRFLDRPPAGAGAELEVKTEIRGLVVLPEGEQDWGLVAPRFGGAPGGRLQEPPELAPEFREARPPVRGFTLESAGSAREHPPLLCAFHTPLRELTIQPIFVDARGPDPFDPNLRVKDLPKNPHGNSPPWVDLSKVSGKSFETVMQRAKDIWAKVCLEFDVLPPKVVLDKDYFVLDSQLRASHFSDSVKPDGKSVQVYVADRWGLSGQIRPSRDPTPRSVYGGGSYTALGGTASAYIVTVDSQVDVPAIGPDRCRNGAAGAVNMNHLAHEIGHAVGLTHPGDYSPARGVLPAFYPGTKGSVMEPSGYCADNPVENGRGNADLMHSPLLRNLGSCCGAPEIDDIVKRWWVKP